MAWWSTLCKLSFDIIRLSLLPSIYTPERGCDNLPLWQLAPPFPTKKSCRTNFSWPNPDGVKTWNIHNLRRREYNIIGLPYEARKINDYVESKLVKKPQRAEWQFREQIGVSVSKLKLLWANWSCRERIAIAVNEFILPWVNWYCCERIEIAVSELKLPSVNWNCREQIKIAVNKLIFLWVDWYRCD